MVKESYNGCDLFKELAVKNETFVQSIDSYSNEVGWRITIRYYSALHYVNYFYCKTTGKQPPKNHDFLKKEIDKDPKNKTLLDCFKILENKSRFARYGHIENEYLQSYPDYIKLLNKQLEEVIYYFEIIKKLTLFQK